jgi:aspartate kinase
MEGGKYLVQKYGGGYLRSIEDLTRIADYVAEHREQLGKLVLVTASLHEIAMETLERAEQFGEGVKKPELDALFSASEYQTAALRSAALEQRGISARVIADIRGHSLDDVDLDNGKHELKMRYIQETLNKGTIPVIAGFQGIGEFETSDRKGRYGAAATAVAVAGALGCDCELYGDTKCVYVVEPKYTDGSKIFSKISYEEAMELVTLSENDLEAEAIELGKMLDVKIYVGPAFEEEKTGGTYIVNKRLIVEEAAVSGISTYDDVVVYTIKGLTNQGDEMSELFELLGDLKVNLNVISQQPYQDDTCVVSFSCEKPDIQRIDDALAVNGRFKDLETVKQEDICMISLVGVGMATHVGVAGKVFATLAENGIPHYNITTSEISITATIDAAQKAEAVVALAEAFQL